MHVEMCTAFVHGLAGVRVAMIVSGRLTLEDAACEKGMWVRPPAIEDVVVVPHHDLRNAGKGVCHVLAAPVLAVVGEVESRRLFCHCFSPLC